MTDNRVELNTGRLTLLNNIVRKTMSITLESVDMGVLAKPANIEQMERFNNNVKNIVTVKLRNKFLNDKEM